MSDHLTDFIKSVTPEAPDRSVVAARRTKVEDCLNASSLDAGLFRESGSWSHGTAVRGKSDVDYMAWALGPQPALPSSALAAAKNVLLDNRDELGIWDVRVSTPVVQVEFFTLPFFEIALGWYHREVRGFDVFRIGGRRDEWVDSAPKAHRQYVNEQNDRLNKRLKPLIRLLKAWKLHVGAPISSFYLEMRAAKYAANEDTLLLDLDLRYLMSDLARSGLPDMNDPQEIGLN